jgi:Tfp pilus assembly protein PilP
MKLRIAILALGMTAGSAWGQNPQVIQNTRNTAKALQQKQANDSNAALAASEQPTNSATQGATGAKATARNGSANKTTAIQATPKTRTVTAKVGQPKQKIAVETSTTSGPAPKNEKKAINLTGKRDPFLSPVISQAMVGSGCSTGKRCLAVDQITLKGVVRADTGMIAVVVNAVDKAYFLRENDPVFNGYVVRITGDSVIFKETIHDRLGKPLTREVTKKITTPAV